MKDIRSASLYLVHRANVLLIAGMAGALLAACNRTEPTPDPPPAPPNPQTQREYLRGIEPGIHPAIFVYPASDLPPGHVGGDMRVAT
jgi:hypothetical protein